MTQYKQLIIENFGFESLFESESLQKTNAVLSKHIMLCKRRLIETFDCILFIFALELYT